MKPQRLARQPLGRPFCAPLVVVRAGLAGLLGVANMLAPNPTRLGEIECSVFLVPSPVVNSQVQDSQ
jgi:hypothetical protein